MKRIKLLIALLLISNLLFAQSETTTPQQTIDRKQGKLNLDASRGFGEFMFGTPIKAYKNFKFIPDRNESSKRYISTVPVNYNGIIVKSVSLGFYKNKLFSMTMHIDKSQVEKLVLYCLKNYGPRGRDLDDDGTYFWRGKIKTITFYEIENNEFEVLFVDNTDSNKRMAEDSKSIFK